MYTGSHEGIFIHFLTEDILLETKKTDSLYKDLTYFINLSYPTVS